MARVGTPHCNCTQHLQYKHSHNTTNTTNTPIPWNSDRSHYAGSRRYYGRCGRRRGEGDGRAGTGTQCSEEDDRQKPLLLTGGGGDGGRERERAGEEQRDVATLRAPTTRRAGSSGSSRVGEAGTPCPQPARTGAVPTNNPPAPPHAAAACLHKGDGEGDGGRARGWMYTGGWVGGW